MRDLIRYMGFALVVGSLGLVACSESTTSAFPDSPPTVPGLTLGSGVTSALLAQTHVGDFHVKTNYNHFKVELKTHDNADVILLNATVQPGGHTGWHYHPGPVLVMVKTGTFTVYHADNCQGVTYPAGTTFIESTSPHIVRNEGGVASEFYAFFFVPTGVARRIEADQPANCPL